MALLQTESVERVIRWRPRRSLGAWRRRECVKSLFHCVHCGLAAMLRETLRRHRGCIRQRRTYRQPLLRLWCKSRGRAQARGADHTVWVHGARRRAKAGRGREGRGGTLYEDWLGRLRRLSQSRTETLEQQDNGSFLVATIPASGTKPRREKRYPTFEVALISSRLLLSVYTGR